MAVVVAMSVVMIRATGVVGRGGSVLIGLVCMHGHLPPAREGRVGWDV